MNKLLLTVLLVLTVNSAVLSINSISGIAKTIQTDLVDTTAKIVAPIPDLIRIPIITQDADLYSGSAEVDIEDGDKKRIDFFGTFIPNEVNCSHSKCYYGWIDNYTITGEDTVVGFTNASLAIKPVFQFKTNSEVDFVIVRNPNLEEQWVQIIEILCQKVNPQITQAKPASDKAFATAQDQKFQVRTASNIQDFSKSTVLPTTSEIQAPEESLLPQYNFRTIETSDLTGSLSQNLVASSLRLNSNNIRLSVGDRFATSEQRIPLDGFKAPTSLFSQTLLLSNENVVKSRTINYELKLDSTDELTDTNEKVPDFNGFISLNFGFSQRIKTPLSNTQTIRNLLAGSNRAVFDLPAIDERRAKLAETWDPQVRVVVDNGPTFEDAEVLTFNNEKSSGINVVDQFSKASAATTPLTFNSEIMSAANLGRTLQILQNYTVYNYKKTLISKSIFGKTFSADVEVKCYVLVYPSDHQIQCIGSFNYQLFGKTKSVTIFNFKKSVSFSWTWSKQYKGSWDFAVAIPLPPPVSFIHLTFSFKVSYVIDVKIDINAGQNINPYQVKVNALATTKVNTDASAGIRVVVIEGGVFMSGTLVEVGTDPKITLSYYFTKKYINILAQWYFWINAFNYKWGFYYKTWRLFKGWSGRKIIKQWTINGVYGKWVIVNKSWNVYL